MLLLLRPRPERSSFLVAELVEATKKSGSKSEVKSMLLLKIAHEVERKSAPKK